jgi:gliding motility-associated-like protein
VKKALIASLIIIIHSFSLSAQVNLPLGLKAYYPFTGNANDVSGNNNNPVFNNATLTADRFGNPNSAYHFNGTSSYMQVPNSPSLNMSNTLSISLWVKPTGWYTGQCYNNMMLIKGDGDNVANRYSSRFSDVQNGCSANPSTTNEQFFDGFTNIATTPIVQLNQWYSVVITFDGTTSKIYVNCVLRGSTANSSSFTNVNDLFIGHLNNAQFPYWLNGDLDEIRIYDRALNQDEVNTLGGCITPVACNNWLSTPTYPSTVSIGNLNVSGNQITVEANFNCTSYTPSGFGGDLIAKHTNAANTCYALSPHAAEISTSNNGYVVTLQTCPFQLNKTYHAAMVYDGASLKFYRDGFLISQTPCSGNISSNNLIATIGNGPTLPIANQFIGYINEMRIWNVARTQAQLQTYMNSSLPNPTTQPGLLAYYTFDNLINKQGNAAWNGVSGGGSSVNALNPNCTFVADSCAVTVPSTNISNIINDYTPVQAFNICENKLTVEDATKFNAGDTVLMIQMKGAVIDSTNTTNFGTITDYKNAGNYEFNYVKSKIGNIIELKNKIIRQYDIPFGKVQLVRVPYYTSVNVSANLTCLPWDGSKGGVLVLNVKDTVNLSADIDVSGRGFKGGVGYNPGNASLSCFQNNYFYPSNTLLAAQKGESISYISPNISCGKGDVASGGGGGAGHNSGGGGGGNAGTGGFGGYQLEPCGNAPFDNRGIGGRPLIYNTVTNKIFMGGGGGAGHADNPGNIPPSGGNGAAIIIISSDKFKSNSRKIIANGDNGLVCTIPASANCHDGMGGGGAGGTLLLNITQYLDNALIENKGGKGADMIGGPIAIAGRIGAGGGGGGGLTFLKPNSLPANVSITNTGGLNGVLTQDGNNPWGATPGAAGQNLFNLIVPVSNAAFQKNIDSVRIKDSILICTSFDFKGLAYVNTNPVTNWQWSFGDGTTSTLQNTTHTYTASGIYNVKLVVTDINGCKDSISKNITATIFKADAGNDTTICTNNTVSLMLHAGAGVNYTWTPAIFLNNPSIQNPIATISSTTLFSVTISNLQGCVASDTVKITIAPPVPNIRYQTITAFTNQSVQLQARNLGGNSYLWLPPVGLNNSLIISPVFSYNQSQEYKINIKNALGCNVTDTILITIKGKKGIYVPRAFSPNSNGTNDRLYPILVGISKLNYFRVYNRWGNLVFETNSGNPAAGWDGTVHGNPQPPETYTWTVEGIDIDGIVIRKSGNTFLIR